MGQYTSIYINGMRMEYKSADFAGFFPIEIEVYSWVKTNKKWLRTRSFSWDVMDNSG